MADEETRPLGSSADVGWQDGKPRIIGDDARAFLVGKGSRVTDSKISGRMPRPRSKNPPKPALTVNYGDVPRNQMDNINLEEVSARQGLGRHVRRRCSCACTRAGLGRTGAFHDRCACVCVWLCVAVAAGGPRASERRSNEAIRIPRKVSRVLRRNCERTDSGIASGMLPVGVRTRNLSCPSRLKFD
jgi:hypothetical protein